MKKSSSSRAEIPASKVSTKSRSAAASAASRLTPASEASNEARLELARPTTLAVLEPAGRSGVASQRRVRFGYFNPDARAVHLVGSFNGWDPHRTPMRRDAFGDWSVEIDLPPGEHRYRFFVDGEWRDDPTAPLTAQNPFGGFDALMVVV